MWWDEEGFRVDLVGEASCGGMGVEKGLGWTWWVRLDVMG